MRVFLFFFVLFYFLFFNISPLFGSSCIDINTSSKQELEEITGVGPVLSQNIIDARPFSSLDELIKVSGIAEKKLAHIKEEGLACVQSQTKNIPEIQIQAAENKSSSQQLEQSKPKIIFSYPQNNPINKEIEVVFSISNLKNASYDVKISIEKEKTFSDIYNEQENKWQSSHYYINNLFSGGSFEKTFKLKIKEENFNFQGEADILTRIRESGKSNYLEHKEKINLNEPEYKTENEASPVPAKKLAAANQQIPETSGSLRVFFTALFIAVSSGIIILILKRKMVR